MKVFYNIFAVLAWAVFFLTWLFPQFSIAKTPDGAVIIRTLIALLAIGFQILAKLEKNNNKI